MDLLAKLQAGLVVWRESLSPRELELAAAFRQALDLAVEQSLAEQVELARQSEQARVSPQVRELVRQELAKVQQQGKA